MEANKVDDLSEKIYQGKLEWSRRRLEALDKIEAKLQEMKALAAYAASRSLSKTESAQVQEWVDILQSEVIVMDKETALRGESFVHNILSPAVLSLTTNNKH